MIKKVKSYTSMNKKERKTSFCYKVV